jgi:replicative DNA helicase
MAKRDLTVFRASGMTVTEIQSVSMAYGFEVLFIDYVQLVTPEVDPRAPRSEKMADVSRTLHTFAQQSGTLVVELAQLTRQERGAWREPDMHDLKESGQFEQDADVILLIYRPNPKDEQSDQEHNRVLRIAKNKEGRQGRFPLFFDGDRQTFSMVTPDNGRDVMRKMTAAGKKARQLPRQVSFWADGSAFQEVPDDKDNPFTQEVKHDET